MYWYIFIAPKHVFGVIFVSFFIIWGNLGKNY